MTENEVFEELKKIIADNFEIDPAQVTRESNIVTDLDLDSIDAIDMVAELQKKVGCRLSAEDFKSVKTVGDIVKVVADRI
ncbi:MAG: acyl carrier protein [Ruminobacter sp.]|uniref:Acyl carrier protein n=1 Tax=Ruminobacter amylophilus TaxID=867 RepID=A0A662ZHY5_9GAMM|nr:MULTISPECIES: acyl carrier protein [Ruminobacter]MBQ3774892.1 acyl carrier protein [Ruminobacter sp.]SFP04713.1 acyl carrier protein [Ruminobacter amylophilus]